MCGCCFTLYRTSNSPLLLKRNINAAGDGWRLRVARHWLRLVLIICGTIAFLGLEEHHLVAECRNTKKRPPASEERKNKEEEESTEETEMEDVITGESLEAERGNKERKRGETKEKQEEKKKHSFCSNGLRDAVNAAILELAGQHYVANVLLTRFPTLPYVPVLTCPIPSMPVGARGGKADGALVSESDDKKARASSGSRGGESGDQVGTVNTAVSPPSKEAADQESTPEHLADSLWPRLTDVQPADLLLDVLNNGKLLVAGLGAEEFSPANPFAQRYYPGWPTLRRRRIAGSGRPLPAPGVALQNATAVRQGGEGLNRKAAGDDNGAETKDPMKSTNASTEKVEKEAVLITQTSRGFNWGDEGDYSVAHPTGYFPTYMRAIAERISEHYGRPVEVVWVFFSSGVDCLRSVERGITHMTDLYFFSAYQKDSRSTWEKFSHTCPVSGAPNLFVTLKEYNIHSLQDLVSHIRMSPDPRLRTIAYLSAGNYETIQQFFPAHTLAEIMTREEAEHRVAAKHILGNIRTGSVTSVPPDFAVVDLGLILAQAPYFKRTDVPHCLYHQLLMREAARGHHASWAAEAEGNTEADESAGAPGALWGHHLFVDAVATAAGTVLLSIATAIA